MSCTSYKSLQITFTAPEIKPANGYLVKWRVVGDSTYQTVSPNPQGSPIVIPSVPSCFNIEGTIQTACADGSYGAPLQFVVASGTNDTGCKSYSVTNNSDLPDSIQTSDLWIRYKPCNSDSFATLKIPINTPGSHKVSIATGICADPNYGVSIIAGSGVVNQEGSCTSNNPVILLDQ